MHQTARFVRIRKWCSTGDQKKCRIGRSQFVIERFGAPTAPLNRLIYIDHIRNFNAAQLCTDPFPLSDYLWRLQLKSHDKKRTIRRSGYCRN
jgi:hypothetical protein